MGDVQSCLRARLSFLGVLPGRIARRRRGQGRMGSSSAGPPPMKPPGSSSESKGHASLLARSCIARATSDAAAEAKPSWPSLNQDRSVLVVPQVPGCTAIWSIGFLLGSWASSQRSAWESACSTAPPIMMYGGPMKRGSEPITQKWAYGVLPGSITHVQLAHTSFWNKDAVNNLSSNLARAAWLLFGMSGAVVWWGIDST